MLFDHVAVAEMRAIIREYERIQEDLVQSLAKAHERIAVLELEAKREREERKEQEWDDY